MFKRLQKAILKKSKCVAQLLGEEGKNNNKDCNVKSLANGNGLLLGLTKFQKASKSKLGTEI